MRSAALTMAYEGTNNETGSTYNDAHFKYNGTRANFR
jgi:hypothetical protein